MPNRAQPILFMNVLTAYMAQELPRINQTLHDVTCDLEPEVLPLVEHVLKAGGKRIRPLLTILMARAMGYTKDDIYPMAVAVELLHSASLLHDDILDNAKLRRGAKAAHVVYGNSHAILGGDILFALANKIAASYQVPALTHSLAQAIMHTATGEIKEIALLRDPHITRRQYLDIITGKTAYLIQVACQCGAIIAGGDTKAITNAKAFGLNLGIAFQIVDDALDYTSTAKVSGKPLGGDLREGKFTLPLVLYLQTITPEKRTMVMAKLAKNALTDQELGVIIKEIQELKLDIKTRDEAGTFLDLATTTLAPLPQCPEKEVLISFIDFVLHRNK
ncbi:MAG: polyprenyl synthetase family protein [Desulfoplanes sp.]|nr:polyprenyl synthetase family protein [Desulfoplanes sp.]